MNPESNEASNGCCGGKGGTGDGSHTLDCKGYFPPDQPAQIPAEQVQPIADKVDADIADNIIRRRYSVPQNTDKDEPKQRSPLQAAWEEGVGSFRLTPHQERMKRINRKKLKVQRASRKRNRR